MNPIKTQNKFEKFMVMGITCILALNLGIGVVEAASISPLQDSQKIELVVKSEKYSNGTIANKLFNRLIVIKPQSIIDVRENQSPLDRYMFKLKELKNVGKNVEYMTGIYTGSSNQNHSHSVDNLNEKMSINYNINIKYEKVSIGLIKSLIKEDSNPETRNYSFLKDSSASGGYTVVIGNKIVYDSINNTITEIANEVGLKDFSKNFDSYKSMIEKRSQEKINTLFGEQAVSINSISIGGKLDYKDINELTVSTSKEIDGRNIKISTAYEVKYTINPSNGASFDIKTVKRKADIFVMQQVNKTFNEKFENYSGVTPETKINQEFKETMKKTDFKVGMLGSEGEFTIKVKEIVGTPEVYQNNSTMLGNFVPIGGKVEAEKISVLKKISDMRVVDQSLVKTSGLNIK